MADAVQEVLGSVVSTLAARGRDDLVARVRASAVRAARPATVVCVVGEFKQGKSLLVNALLGRPICPVDDDLATATITVVQHGAETSVVVYRRRDGKLDRRTVEPSALPAWVTERGDPAEREGVERVVVSVDHPLLARGLTIVDTPGVGGLTSGHARATNAFLPYADALIFVTDASQELTAPELGFLTLAAERCPHVLVAVAKTDLYPEWRRITDLDRGHLGALASEVSIHPVSATAAIAAMRQNDAALAAESGVPGLRDALVEDIIDTSRAAATARSLAEATDIVDHMIAVTGRELEVIQDPERIVRANAAYQDAVSHLETLKGPGSRWSLILNDRMADVSSRTTFEFRRGMREIAAWIDERIEELSSPKDWDDLSAELQDRVAGHLATAFTSIEDGASAIATELADLIADEAAADLLPEGLGIDDLHLDDLTGGSVGSLGEASKGKRVAGAVVPALRGAQSGLLMFGLMGRFLPLGAAGLMMSNPVTMVIGAAFAGKQVFSVKKRNLMMHRQKARVAVRSFLDNAQFETSHQLTEATRRHQRALRDTFSGRISELQRTYQAMAEQAKKNVAATYQEQASRAEQLRQDMAHLQDVRKDLATARAGETR